MEGLGLCQILQEESPQASPQASPPPRPFLPPDLAGDHSSLHFVRRREAQAAKDEWDHLTRYLREVLVELSLSSMLQLRW